MQLEFKLKRIFPVVIGLTLLWGIFLLSEFLLVKKENRNLLYIPTSADLVVHIDGKSFFQSAIYDVFIADKDREVFSQLEKLAKKDFDNTPWRDAGIDLLSDVVYFEKSLANGKISGFLFNLTNLENFQKNTPLIFGKNQFSHAKNDVGILIKTAGEISPIQAKMFAKKTLLKETLNQKFLQKTIENGQFLTVFTSDKSAFGKGEMKIQMRSSQLLFDGEFIESARKNASNWTLRKDGFHLVSSIIPSNLVDTLQSKMRADGFFLPKINRLSVNYRGTNIGESNILPDGDLLLSFESEIDKKTLIENQIPWQKLGFVIEASTENGLLLLREDKVYTLRILDDKTLFFGLNSANVLQQKNNDLFILEGDMTNLTEINGGGLMAVGLNFYPPYKASKQLFQSFSVANIQFKSSNGKANLIGKFEFKNQKSVMTEMLRFMLTLNN